MTIISKIADRREREVHNSLNAHVWTDSFDSSATTYRVCKLCGHIQFLDWSSAIWKSSQFNQWNGMSYYYDEFRRQYTKNFGKDYNELIEK